MTRVYGVALDPESSSPLVGRLVTVALFPKSAHPAPDPIAGGVDRAVTGSDGTWELNLRPTAGTGVAMRIRVWEHATYYVDVPEAVGDDGVDVESILVDPGSLDPSTPPSPSLYLTRAERGAANGVASLDSAGKVPSVQLPPGQGGDENPVVDWFTGHGPPTGTITGAALGDMYQDLDTGLLYQLR